MVSAYFVIGNDYIPFHNLVWGKKMQAKNENFVRKKSKKYFTLR